MKIAVLDIHMKLKLIILNNSGCCIKDFSKVQKLINMKNLIVTNEYTLHKL